MPRPSGHRGRDHHRRDSSLTGGTARVPRCAVRVRLEWASGPAVVSPWPHVNRRRTGSVRQHSDWAAPARAVAVRTVRAVAAHPKLGVRVHVALRAHSVALAPIAGGFRPAVLTLRTDEPRALAPDSAVESGLRSAAHHAVVERRLATHCSAGGCPWCVHLSVAEYYLLCRLAGDGR
jgi:hypothetical protein